MRNDPDLAHAFWSVSGLQKPDANVVDVWNEFGAADDFAAKSHFCSVNIQFDCDVTR